MEVLRDLFLIVITNHEVLQFFGLIFSVMLIWLMKRILSLVGLHLRADRLAMLSLAIDKAMTLAVVKAEQVISEKGWNALDSRVEVINAAIPILEEKFRDTLRENGLNLDDEEDRRRIREQMMRMLPDVFSRVAASPATPGNSILDLLSLSQAQPSMPFSLPFQPPNFPSPFHHPPGPGSDLGSGPGSGPSSGP